jgi:hypothetical protein
MVEVPLANGRGVALVDDEDAERVLAYRWFRHSSGYAVRNVKGERGRVRMLHREIVGLEPGDPREVDHISRARLDCRRANLRIVTRAENRQNTPAIGGTSRARGVSRIAKTGRWRAFAQLGGAHVHIGCFATEAEAAEAAATWRAENMPFAVA